MTIYTTLRSSFAAALLISGATRFAAVRPMPTRSTTSPRPACSMSASSADFPPFSSASADMSFKGYDMDVAQALADALKVKLNPVSVTGQNRIPYLTEKRVDLLMSVGFCKEREQVIDFAAAYAPYYIAVIGPKALEVKSKDDLAGKSIAVNRGTLEDTSLTEVLRLPPTSSASTTITQ